MALPAEYDIKLKQGATYNKEITWTDGANQPIDVAGSTIKFEILVGKILKTYTTTSGHITIGGGTGKFAIKIPASETLTYIFDKARYELGITLPNAGDTVPLLAGSVINKKRFK